MMNNKDVFGPQDVTQFIPERFLREGITDPYATFGFGRRYESSAFNYLMSRKEMSRICPGRYHAQSSMFISVASILHVFRIGRNAGSTGDLRQEDFKWSTGIAV